MPKSDVTSKDLDFVWLNIYDHEDEADSIFSAALDEKLQSGQEIEDWERVGYLDIWEFVTACFTREGCEKYIESNGYNLNSPRIYVASAYRNQEFISVRKMLKSLDGSPLTKEVNKTLNQNLILTKNELQYNYFIVII